MNRDGLISAWARTEGFMFRGPGGGEPKKSSTQKYACPKCGQSIRATKTVNIICGDCMKKWS